MEIYKSLDIPRTKEEHIKFLSTIKIKISDCYKVLLDHYGNTNLDTPSNIKKVIEVFNIFEQTILYTNRVLSNLQAYINIIRSNNLNNELQTQHMEKIANINKLVCDIRHSVIGNNSHIEFLESYSQKKDKYEEVFFPSLALMERNVMMGLMNNLSSIRENMDIIIKYLNDCENLKTIDEKFSAIHQRQMYY